MEFFCCCTHPGLELASSSSSFLLSSRTFPPSSLTSPSPSHYLAPPRRSPFAIRAFSADEPWRSWIPPPERTFDATPIHDHPPSSTPSFLVDKCRVPRLPRTLDFFPRIGKSLLIMGLGLCFTTPASARTPVPSTSTVSVENTKLPAPEDDIMPSNDKAAAIDTTGSLSPQSAVSDSSQNSSSPAVSSDDGSSNAMKSEESLHLSEAFWRGIPTPDGSPMHSLKSRLSENPGDRIALEFLLRAVMEKRDMLRALTVIETLLEVQPDSLKWKFLKARAHEFLGELAMAKMEYEELVNQQPFSARFMQGLVMLLDKLGEGAEALKLIQAALEKAQSEKRIIEARNLGILLSQFYIQLGNFDGALQQLNVMIDEDPDDFRPYLCQGLAYTLMDQTEKAEENFKKYKQLCPPDYLEQSYFDELMLAAKVDRQNDTILKAAMKSSFKKRKKPKMMQQPSVSGRERTDEESMEDS